VEDEQDAALRTLRAGRHTFLTGPAGTGKSYVVRRFLDACDQDGRQALVCAATGVAAMLLPGGETLHKMTGVPVTHNTPAEDDPHEAWLAAKDAGAFLGDATDEDDEFEHEDSPLVLRAVKPRSPFVRDRLRSASVLVIDEVSMIDARTLDAAAWLVAHARSAGPDSPFGGLQVVFVGDLAQLPPVEGNRWGWAHESAAWRALAPEVISLETIRRQSGDVAFSSLLGRLRMGDLAPDDAKSLLTRVGAFDPRTATRILPTNKECEAINARELVAVPSQLRTSVAVERAARGLEFMLERLNDGPSPRKLDVKLGARVIITANDQERPARYANGTGGVVREIGVPPFGLDAARLERETAEREERRAKGWRPRPLGELADVAEGESPKGVTIELDSGEQVWIGKHTWKIERGSFEIASRVQYPLRLGWAITAHRAQGATLTKASVNLEKCFTEGQAYVALSRVKSLDGLNLESSRMGVVAAHPRFLRFERERRAGRGT
jgi:ATP-dependent DNA helicase PIF1